MAAVGYPPMTEPAGSPILLETPLPSRRAPFALLTWGVVVIVLVVVLVLVIIKITAAPATSPGTTPPPSAPSGLVQSVTHIPKSAFDAVGMPDDPALTPAQVLSGQPKLTSDSKAVVASVDAEYCPYCAAQRWAVVVALGRFGRFEDLAVTTSAADDAFPGTKSFSFDNAKYESRYVRLEAVEEASDISGNDSLGYASLDRPTPLLAELAARYDVPPYVSSAAAGAVPFTDIGNRLLLVGPDGFSPALLAGLSMDQIASDLRVPTTPVARGVLGTANAITAGICSATANQPSSVCDSPGVLGAAHALGLD